MFFILGFGRFWPPYKKDSLETAAPSKTKYIFTHSFIKGNFSLIYLILEIIKELEKLQTHKIMLPQNELLFL